MCSSSTPWLPLFMLRLLRILFYSVLLFIPEGGEVPPQPLSTSVACINTREFRSVWQAIQTPTQCVQVALPLLKTHLSVGRGGFSIEPRHVKDFQN